jgi:hypothetical protein
VRAFLALFKDIVSPGMLEMFFQLIHAQHDLRFVVFSGLNKELYKFPNHNFRSSYHLYPPWWMNQEWSNRPAAAEVQSDEDFYD